MPGSKAAPSGTKANPEGDRKSLGPSPLPCREKRPLPRLAPPAPKPSGRGAGRGGAPFGRGSSNPRRPGALAPAPPRTARTPGRLPLMVWPVGSRHPFGSASCSSCSGSSAGARSCGCRGRWAGGGENRTINAGCSARAAAEGSQGARETRRDRPQPGGEDPGAGLSSPRVSTCCPNPPRPPFPVPTPARCGPPPGRSLARDH